VWGLGRQGVLRAGAAGAPHGGGCRARPGSWGLSHCPGQEQSRWGGHQGSPRALPGESPSPGQDVGPEVGSSAGPMAGQGRALGS